MLELLYIHPDGCELSDNLLPNIPKPRGNGMVVMVYVDNQSVLANTTMPESTLNNKTQSIAFHHVREGTARD